MVSWQFLTFEGSTLKIASIRFEPHMKNIDGGQNGV